LQILLRSSEYHKSDSQFRVARADRSSSDWQRRRQRVRNRKKLEKEIAAVPGTVDVHVHQVTDHPEIQVNVDRSKANNVGLTERDVSKSLLISLSSSGGPRRTNG
jgi:multidrug efflux pump subunit AcrB